MISIFFPSMEISKGPIVGVDEDSNHSSPKLQVSKNKRCEEHPALYARVNAD
jgi:hypothetical protein